MMTTTTVIDGSSAETMTHCFLLTTIGSNSSSSSSSPSSSPLPPSLQEDNASAAASVAATSGGAELLEFPVLSQTATVTFVFSAAYVTVFVLSLVNNSAVLSVIRRNPQMKTVTNYFLANLAAADLIVTFTVLPITLLSNILTEWHFGWFLCKTVPYIQAVAVSASVNTLTAVAIERFCVIYFPARVVIKPTVAFVIIFLIWALPVCCTQIPWILFYELGNVPHYSRPLRHCYLDIDPERKTLVQGYFLGVVFLTCYLLPLCLITIFYSMIATKVCSRRVSGIRGSKTERNIQASKVRIVRMLVAVAVVFACSWLPLYALRLRILFGERLQGDEKVLVRRYINPMTQWLGSANSCVNPFIYCYFSKPFRLSILAVFRATLACLLPCWFKTNSARIQWPKQSMAGSFISKTELSRHGTIKDKG